MSTVRLVMAREPIPAGPKIFLAGPTPDRSTPVPSWRPKTLDLITARWAGVQPLTVLPTPASAPRRFSSGFPATCARCRA